MRQSYTESFLLHDPEFSVMPALQLLAEETGIVKVRFNPVWREMIQPLVFELQAPVAEPMRYIWDRDVFGHKVAFWPRGAERYCHPRLCSPVAEALAASPRKERRELFETVTDWQFYWEGYHDRLHRALWNTYHEKIKTTRQRLTVPIVRAHFQRAISQLMNGGPSSAARPTGWAENGASDKLGFPLTDEALLIRHLHEVEAGYPDILGDSYLFEKIKLAFLAHLDTGVDLTFSGKSDCGRLVLRVRPEDPHSQVTERPMPKLALLFNPMHGISNPKRTARENRSSCAALPLINPIAPPLRSTAVNQTPEPFQERITTLTVAFFDAEGLNAWTADAETAAQFPNTSAGEIMSLDGLLLTRTGREKLAAYASRNVILEEDEYLERREGWSNLPGFREQEIPEVVEVLGDGTLVCTRNWRCWWDEPIPAAYGKYKLTVGGIKGVGRPIHQLFYRINGKLEPIDMVVSAQTVISKGAVDAILYALAAQAGLTEIDPTWSRAEIGTRVTSGLQEKGHSADGCFEIVRKQRVETYGDASLGEKNAALMKGIGVTLGQRFEKVTLGRAIVGPAPVVVAQEHEFRASNVNRGVSLAIHPRLTQDLPIRHDPKTEQLIEKIGQFWCDATAVGGNA